MYVQPNTPTLPFESDCPHPTPEELDSVIDWYRVFAREAAAADDPAFAQIAAQAVACLVLLRIFAWSRPTPAQRSLRGLMRQRRRADRTAWLGMVGPFLVALSLLCVGCAAEVAPVDLLPGQPGDELPAPTCEEPSEPSEMEPAELEPSLLALDAPACTGHWVDNSDSSTRLDAHPDTGKCTFACVWQEPKCRESWYGDVRCFPAHAAHLGMLCAELGGRCERAKADGLPYCVAR